jgi:hypothetical protein
VAKLARQSSSASDARPAETRQPVLRFAGLRLHQDEEEEIPAAEAQHVGQQAAGEKDDLAAEGEGETKHSPQRSTG